MQRIALLLIVCVAASYAEECTTNTDCASTSCTAGSHVVCQHPNPSAGIEENGGLCTCALTDTTCNTQADCEAYWETLECISVEHVHCYDQQCVCTRW